MPTFQPPLPEKELAVWFKSLRKHSLNLTQEELAERTGIPLGTIRYYEQTGRTSLQNFLRIAKQLHVLDHFLEPARGAEPKTFQKAQKEQTPLMKLARKKELARKRDHLRIKRGEVSRDQLQAENSIIPMKLANDPEWKAKRLAAAVASLNRPHTKLTLPASLLRNRQPVP